MTVKLVGLYRRPDDPEAFLHHYRTIHTPLVRQIPGLQKLVVSDVAAPGGGEAPYFLMAEMHFANRGAFDAAMRSPENRAAGKDLMGFAKGLVTLFVAEEL